jgi:hypothetical protein
MINVRRGLARTAHDQAEHLTALAILVQNGLERRRITRLVMFGIEFASFLPVIGFDFRLSLFYCEAEIIVLSFFTGLLRSRSRY